MRLHIISLVFLLALTPLSGRAQWRTSVLPVLGSAPETGGQFGVAVFRTRQPDDSLGTRPSSLIGNAILTSKGQQRAFVEYDRWTTSNERRLQVLAIASKFPLPFYGYGDQSARDPMEYEPRTLELSITRSRKSGQASWRYAALRLVDTKVNSFSPNYLVDPFPCDSLGCGLSPELDGVPRVTDYRLTLATLGWIRDSRDNLFAATSGGVFDISLTGGLEWGPGRTGPRDVLTRLRVDWRRYRPLGNGGVLAGQVTFSDAYGEFPIDQVMLVGHHSFNRGYTMGRFRDRGMLAAQLEWRSPTNLWNDRLGFASFAGVALLRGESRNDRPLPSAGAGLRYRLDPRTRSTIRVDYAIGASGQKGLYVAFNEAF